MAEKERGRVSVIFKDYYPHEFVYGDIKAVMIDTLNDSASLLSEDGEAFINLSEVSSLVSEGVDINYA